MKKRRDLKTNDKQLQNARSNIDLMALIARNKERVEKGVNTCHHTGKSAHRIEAEKENAIVGTSLV